MLRQVKISGLSLNLQDPLLRLTGIHPRQTGGTSFDRVLRFRMRERPAYSNPGPVRAVLNTVVASKSSSESGRCHLCASESIILFLSLNGYALHPPWSPTRGRYTETALQFPAPKLHTRHTRRARFQSTSDYPSFNNN